VAFSRVLLFSSSSLFSFSFYPAIKRRVGLHVDEIQTYKKSKRTLFIRTRQNTQVFGVIPFVKLQNDTGSFLYIVLYLDKVF